MIRHQTQGPRVVVAKTEQGRCEVANQPRQARDRQSWQLFRFYLSKRSIEREGGAS